jgi:hypothetical protein
MFPEELPRRLIRMFTFVGDMVLDPFLGSGTTVKAALDLGRNGLGYEINESFMEIIREKVGLKEAQPLFTSVQIIKREQETPEVSLFNYHPRIQDSSVLSSQEKVSKKSPNLPKVTAIQDEKTIVLDDGSLVRFLGIHIEKHDETKKYFQDYLLGKYVILKDATVAGENGIFSAYIYLKNKIFINAYLIKSGLASPDFQVEHRYSQKFRQLILKSTNR